MPRAPDPEEIILEDPEPTAEAGETAENDPHCETEKDQSLTEEKLENEKPSAQEHQTEVGEISDKVMEQALISERD